MDGQCKGGERGRVTTPVGEVERTNTFAARGPSEPSSSEGAGAGRGQPGREGGRPEDPDTGFPKTRGTHVH